MTKATFYPSEYDKPYIEITRHGALSVVITGKVALVSLFRPSDSNLPPAEELAEEIRRKLETSSITSGWIVERVTVLDEDGLTMKILSNAKPTKVPLHG